ncbi:hypothetical protein HK405_015116, partial [Cladochytrium tenue]
PLGNADMNFLGVQDHIQPSALQLTINQPLTFMPAVDAPYLSMSSQSAAMAIINPGMQPEGFGEQGNPDGAGDYGINVTHELAVQNLGTQSPDSHSPRTERANTNNRPAPDGHDGFTMDGQGSYRCNQCDRVIGLMTNMRAHIRTHNPARRLFPCPVCNTTFTRPADRTRHELNCHATPRAANSARLTCNFCGARLKRRDTLLRHSRGCVPTQIAVALGADAAAAAATLPEPFGHPSVAASVAGTFTTTAAAAAAAALGAVDVAPIDFVAVVAETPLDTVEQPPTATIAMAATIAAAFAAI